MIKLPDKYMNMLGKWYLDLVESLPNRDGFIGELQSIRRYQREEAQQTNERLRPLGNASIDYLGIRMFEIFQMEDSRKLLQALWNLLPPAEHQWYRPDFRSEIERQVSSLFGMSYQRIGIVFRDGQTRGFSGPSRKLAGLPEEVDYIEIWLHHLFPSLFVVTFDVVLSEFAVEHLRLIQKGMYLSEIRFKQVVPFTKRGFGYTETLSETITQQRIAAWNESIRYRVEKCLGSTAKGYFRESKSSSHSKLPAIEIYELKGVPGARKFAAWFQGLRFWLESLNLRDVGRTFSNSTMLFILPDSITQKDKSSIYRLVLLSEPYRRTAKVSRKGSSSYRIPLDSSIQYFLTELLGLVAPLEFLRSLQLDIEQLRERVLIRIDSGSLRLNLLPSLFDLNNAVLQVSMILERVSTEFEQYQDRIKYQAKSFQDFRNINDFGDSANRALNDALGNFLDYRMKVLTNHTMLLKEWVNRYIVLHNMAWTYRLTLVIVIATLIGVVGWSSVQSILKQFLTFFSTWH